MIKKTNAPDNNDMKKTVLTLTALASLLASAHANLGDTRDDAIRRYGEPVVTNNEGLPIYQKNGWRIVQGYNPPGYCYWVTYIKLDGTDITGPECMFIDQANHLPGGRWNQSFIAATPTFTAQEVWTDPVTGLALASGTQLIHRKWCFFRAVTNTRNQDGGQERLTAEQVASSDDVPM